MWERSCHPPALRAPGGSGAPPQPEHRAGTWAVPLLCLFPVSASSKGPWSGAQSTRCLSWAYARDEAGTPRLLRMQGSRALWDSPHPLLGNVGTGTVSLLPSSPDQRAGGDLWEEEHREGAFKSGCEVPGLHRSGLHMNLTRMNTANTLRTE